jgi:uncharacterized protein (TIGR03382 family)
VNKHVVQGLVALAGLASAVSVASAQAPTSAQVWDVRFIVDSAGPFAAGPSATAVGITLVARVGLRANSNPLGSTNFGVARVGGAGTPTLGFRMTFTDALSGGQGLNQGTIQPGATAFGQFAEAPRNDASGDALAGAFYPFRSSFDPGGLPAPGDNDNPFNGTFVNPATGPTVATNITIDRARGWNTVPQALGVATLDAAGNITGGDYAAVYRFLFVPRQDLTAQAVRDITVSVTGMSARYVFQVNGDLGSAGATFNLPNSTFSFQVPGPGAAALAALAGLAGLRRRRA